MSEQGSSRTFTEEGLKGGARQKTSLPRGTEFGRYVIIELLGAGGMGAVYRAYDPALNRGVALKVLKVAYANIDVAARAKARLLREAQALAQLSHPNVVSVHDVGSVGDLVFVAMTLVEGKTLREWMKVKRTWEEILIVMIAAGQGLAAAHNAGIVHRDFKPANVMVDENGRVQVLDFGLARGVGSEEPNEPMKDVVERNGSENEVSCFSDYLRSPLTHAGSIVGTPLYMSPEQRLGMKIDERSDVFSFCVVLYEALYRERPFAVVTRAKLKDRLPSYEISEAPDGSEVPQWLREIVVGGLASKPEDRHRSMDVLLDRLVDNPEGEQRLRWLARRRRNVCLSVVGVFGVVLAAALLVRSHYRAEIRARCEAQAKAIDSIWNRRVGEKIAKAFAKSDVHYANDAWSRAWPHVDAYVTNWKRARTKVCLEALQERTRSADMFARAKSCLGEQKARLSRLAAHWAAPTKMTIETAAGSSQSLPLVRFCIDETTLARRTPPSTDPTTLAVLKSLRAELAAADAFDATGQYEKALVLAQKVLSKALGSNLTTIAVSARLSLGSAQQSLGRYDEARTSYETAFHEAEVVGDDLSAHHAASRLIFVAGFYLGQPEGGMEWYWLAAGKPGRLSLGPDHPDVAAALNNLGGVYILKDELKRAEKTYLRALAIFERALGTEHPRLGQTLNSLGSLYLEMPDSKRAESMLQRALVIMEKTLGPNHPKTAHPLTNLGLVYAGRGDYEQAEKHQRGALAIWEKALRPDHPWLAHPLHGLGAVYKARGDYEQAEKMYRRAVVVLEKALGPDRLDVSYPLTNLGGVYYVKGDYEQAEKTYHRSLAILEKALGPDHREVASPLLGLGNVYMARGDLVRAEKMYHRSLAIREKALGPDHPLVIASLVRVGEWWLAQDRFVKARRAFERIVDICERTTCAAEPHGRALLALAKLLVATEAERKRAIGLAKKAKAALAKIPERTKELNEVDAWLREYE